MKARPKSIKPKPIATDLSCSLTQLQIDKMHMIKDNLKNCKFNGYEPNADQKV